MAKLKCWGEFRALESFCFTGIIEKGTIWKTVKFLTKIKRNKQTKHYATNCEPIPKHAPRRNKSVHSHRGLNLPEAVTP